MSGILDIPRRMPQDDREWSVFLSRINQQIQYQGGRAVISALSTISARVWTDFQTLLQYLTDGGRASDQRILPMVNFGNVSSVQSTEPLSATAGPSTADINVSAHTLHTDFGNIAYNSGSIVGLPLATTHYVYADDPNYVGGAVAYVATTARSSVPASSGRYFVGVITTPIAANIANVASATSANPIVIRTSAAHGWTSGNTVSFEALPGDFGTNLNGTQRVITVVDADEFSVAVDGSTFAAYTSGGKATRIVSESAPDLGGGGGGWLFPF